MERHVRVLGILHLFFGCAGILVGFGMLLIFGGVAALLGTHPPSPDALIAVPVLGLVGSVIFILLLVLSLPALIAGIGLLQMRPWARILTLVIAVLNLLNFPVGTALGVYAIWVVASPEGEALFRRQRTA